MSIKFVSKLCSYIQFFFYKSFKVVNTIAHAFNSSLISKIKISKPITPRIKNLSNLILLKAFFFTCRVLNRKFVRAVFIFFELELFFLSHDVFIFIFFIYSIFNRVLLMFLFVILCIKINPKLFFCTKILIS